jgi:short-subunit dehydrogenase
MGRPHVLVTGASMGIGRALALRWAKDGATVVLAARSEEALGEVAREVEAAGGSAVVVPGDVTDAGYRERLVERALAATGSLDVLVNNAGRGFRARTMAIDLDEMRRLFELNVIAPLHLAQLAAPHLEATRGTIVMLSSVAGVVAAPRYGAYSASKFALEALAMAMRSELASRGVRVVVIRPGPVATPFRANAHRAAGEAGYDTPDPKAQSAEEIARQTVRAVARGTAVVETSGFVRLASSASRLAPAALRIALRRMADRPAS